MQRHTSFVHSDFHLLFILESTECLPFLLVRYREEHYVNKDKIAKLIGVIYQTLFSLFSIVVSPNESRQQIYVSIKIPINIIIRKSLSQDVNKVSLKTKKWFFRDQVGIC